MDPVFDGANFQVLIAFAHAFHALHPLKIPGFRLMMRKRQKWAKNTLRVRTPLLTVRKVRELKSGKSRLGILAITFYSDVRLSRFLTRWKEDLKGYNFVSNRHWQIQSIK
ncbi:uncharacterized protein LOC130793641 [Actinidia eriantha]|uniref:uncharacterized protein LOC130793641 n=1 Tax=Actinidia eriantha TaxID=165200 RepID=UPI002589D559|nr:uncharacterized protein LOC130793641 [Actinidia eriantha]